jgi:hypothetical protein
MPWITNQTLIRHKPSFGISTIRQVAAATVPGARTRSPDQLGIRRRAAILELNIIISFLSSIRTGPCADNGNKPIFQ